jgi:hypothetical protein
MQMQILAMRTKNIQTLASNIQINNQEEAISSATELIVDAGEYSNQTYLLKDSAMQMVKKIPLNSKFDIKFLKNVPNKKATFLLGKDLAFRYFKKHGMIYGVFFYLTESDIPESQKDFWNTLAKEVEGTWIEGEKVIGVAWNFIKIDLNTGGVIVPEEVNTKKRAEEVMKTGYLSVENPLANDANFRLFVQLLLFIELSDLEIDILEPKQKIGTRKQGKYLNDSKSNISIVDSKWNVVSVRNESFLVGGHWRMQPCGKNNEERKLIYIDTFEKKGYTRRGGKNQILNYEN